MRREGPRPTHLFLPHAAVLALVIMLGQFLAGGAIAAGILTNVALLGRIFMNLNFLLAGVPNPSAFSIVIQVALLLTHAGAVLGLDAGLARLIRNPQLVAQPLAVRRRRLGRVPALRVGVSSLVIAVYALAHVTDWSPGGSVEDPAMIVAIIALLSLLWATIAGLRQDARERTIPRRRETPSRSRQDRYRQHAADVLRLPRVAALTNWRHAGAPNAGRSRPPRQQRRLAVTFTLTWLDDPHNGDDHAAATTPGTAVRPSSRPVAAGS